MVDDPLERANLKERRQDVYERLEAEWLAWNATMLPEIDESFTGRASPATNRRSARSGEGERQGRQPAAAA